MLLSSESDIKVLGQEIFEYWGFTEGTNYLCEIKTSGLSLTAYDFWCKVEAEMYHCARRAGYFNKRV